MKSWPDVPANKWYSNTIALAKYLFIAHGYSDGMFRPEQPATRAEALSFTMRALAVGLLVSAGMCGLTYYLAKRNP